MKYIFFAISFFLFVKNPCSQDSLLNKKTRFMIGAVYAPSPRHMQLGMSFEKNLLLQENSNPKTKTFCWKNEIGMYQTLGESYFFTDEFFPSKFRTYYYANTGLSWVFNFKKQPVFSSFSYEFDCGLELLRYNGTDYDAYGKRFKVNELKLLMTGSFGVVKETPIGLNLRIGAGFPSFIYAGISQTFNYSEQKSNSKLNRRTTKQEKSKLKDYKNNFYSGIGIFVLAGNACINYERRLKGKENSSLWLKSSIGIWGTWGDEWIYPAVSVTYLKGKGKHKLEGNLGAAFFAYPSSPRPWPVIGIGYRTKNPKKNFLFRTGISSLELVYIGIGGYF